MGKIINIPLNLSTWVLREGMISPFKLYIYLSLNYNGQLKYDTSGLQSIARELGYRTIKSVNLNLQQLFLKQFIGFDAKKQIIYIRSIKWVIANLGIEDRQAVTFSMWNFNKFKERVIASSLRDLSYKCKLLKKKMSRSLLRGEELYQALFI